MTRLMRVFGVAVALLLVGFVSSASAASVTIGHTYNTINVFAFGVLSVQTGGSTASSYVVPAEGTITSWSIDTGVFGAGGSAAAVVLRSTGGSSYTVVGSSATKAVAAGLNTFPTSIAVKPGDILGLWTGGNGACCTTTGTSASDVLSFLIVGAAPGAGASVTTTNSAQCFVSVSAEFTPTSPAGGGGGGGGGGLAITGHPDSSTIVSDATFTFHAQGDPQFKCKLDDGSFDGCSSPKTYTGLSVGSHTFTVKSGGKTVSFSWVITQPPARMTICTVKPIPRADATVGNFVDVQASQYPTSDPNSPYFGAVPAKYAQGKGLTCDNLPGYTDAGYKVDSAGTRTGEGSSIYEYWTKNP